MKKMKKALVLLLVAFVSVSNMSLSHIVSAASVNDYLQVTRTVSPMEMTTEEEATVELNIQGTPPVNVVKPNDVMLVIDKSGSMKNKMQHAIDAAKGFVQLMDLSAHRVGVVDYSSKNSISQLPLTTDGKKAQDYIDTLKANGGTATGDAIDAAIKELQSNPRPDTQPVIVIMTDGDATEPSGTAYEYALKKANEAKDAGIVFYTIALLNENEDPDKSGPNLLLRQMATTSDHHHFVLGSTGLKEIYAEIVKEIGIASAYDITVTDYVNDKFEIVPDSYVDNIPQPTVTDNKLVWSFKELKNKNLKFTYKIRAKSKDKTGMFDVSTSESIVTYKDYAGSNRSKNILNQTIKVKLPAPVITSIVEPAGHPNGGEVVTINGDKFKQGAKVYFDKIEATNVTVENEQLIKATAPSGKLGKVKVSVVNPDAQKALIDYEYVAKPEVTSYTPNEGLISGGTVVAFKGNFFTSGISVKFGDSPATIVTNSTGQYLTVNTPKVEKAGTVDIVLTNPGGMTLTIPGGFTYKEPEKPKLSLVSITQASGLPAGGETIFALGENFSPDVKIYFGANEAQVTYISANRIQLKAPAGKLGEVVDVKALNPDQQESILSKAYTYQMPEYPEPKITSVAPNKGEMAGGNTIYINGDNFVAGLKVFINNKEASQVTVSSAYRIAVKVPSSDVFGTFDVKVVNPDDKGAVLANGYTYNEPVPVPAPKVLSISPASGTMKGGTTVVVNGEHFDSGATVFFNEMKLATTYLGETQLRVKTPVWATPDKVNVSVVNADSQKSAESIGFQYEEPKPEPVSISSITPNKGLATGGNYVYINGDNFKDGIIVKFGEQIAVVKSVSNYRLSVLAPAATANGTVDITVTNPDKGTVTLPGAYTYTLVQPEISSISPAVGPIKGGTSVYINGSNFESDMTVTINGAPVPIASFDGASRVRIVTPPAAEEGLVPIIVTLKNGENATAMFKYEKPPLGPPPKLDSLNVKSGPQAGGNYVYITGDRFVDGAKVYFGTTESTTVVVESVYRLRAKAPAGTGEIEIKVVNPDGQSSNTLKYTYN